MKLSDLELTKLVNFFRKPLCISFVAGSLLGCYGSESGYIPAVFCTLEEESEAIWAMRFKGYDLDCTQIHDFDDAKNKGSVIAIEIQEIAQVDTLDFSGFDDLETLNISNSNITDISVATNNQLAYLYLDTPRLTALELPVVSLRNLALKNLDSLETVNFNQITTSNLHIVGDIHFDASELLTGTELGTLVTNYANLEHYGDIELVNLTKLNLYDVTVADLDLSVVAPALQSLTILDTNRDSLQIISPDSTRNLHFLRSTLGAVDLTQSSSVIALDFHSTSLIDLDMSTLTLLEKLLIAGESNIVNLDLGYNSSLLEVHITGTGLQELDLSGTSVRSVDLNKTNIGFLKFPTQINTDLVGVIKIVGHRGEELTIEGGDYFRNFAFEQNNRQTKAIDISSLSSTKLLVMDQVYFDLLDISSLNLLQTIYINDSTINEIKLPGFFNRESHAIENSNFVCKPGFNWNESERDIIEQYADNVFCLIRQ